MSKYLEGIKNIIFDLGGVLLNIDYEKPAKEFMKLGMDDFSSIYSQAAQNNLFDDLETGKIDADYFFEHISILSKLNLRRADMELAWNSIILDFPMVRVKILEKLSLNYRIFLLSNTNKIHYDLYSCQFVQKYGLHLSDLFEKAYYSFELGLRKPDKEIYEYALKDSQLIPEETLFIEDSPQNLIEAEKLGIRTILLNAEETVERFFNKA